MQDENVYEYFWRPDGGQTYVNGADIMYATDGSVAFTNPLMPPGKMIHEWNVPSKNGTLLGRGPSLVPGCTYTVDVQADVQPANSVALVVTFLDVRGQTLDQSVLNGLSGAFTFPEQGVTLTIGLMNLNNQRIKFKYCVLGASTMMTSLSFERVAGDGLLIHNQNGKSDWDLWLLPRANQTLSVPVLSTRSVMVWQRGTGIHDAENQTQAVVRVLKSVGVYQAKQLKIHAMGASLGTTYNEIYQDLRRP